MNFHKLTDVHSLGGYTKANKDHPKLYFGKWGHRVRPDRSGTQIANACSVNDFVDDDYRYEASKWLVDWDVLPKNWDFGKADSKPAAFDAGGKYDICKL